LWDDNTSASLGQGTQRTRQRASLHSHPERAVSQGSSALDLTGGTNRTRSRGGRLRRDILVLPVYRLHAGVIRFV
ncbi:MAG: hypothetical protein ACE5I0_08970, partial [Candidatus Binatia bacterium]